MVDPLVHRFEIPTPFFEGTTNVYLLVGDPLTLVDSGLGGGEGFELLNEQMRRSGFELKDVQRLLLTHKHADHIGLARKIKDVAGLTVHVHEDDWRDVTDYEESQRRFRDTLATRMREWGVPDDQLARLARQFGQGPPMAESVPARRLRQGDRLPMGDSTIQVLHTPGHTQGSVCFLWQSRLFTGDHVLPDITPNIGLAELLRSNMLGTYLASLEATSAFEQGELVCFPGHGEPFVGLSKRTNELQWHHRERCSSILKHLNPTEPRSVYDIALDLFGELKGIHVPLGTAEASAHVEWLARHGAVAARPGGYVRVNGSLEDLE